MSTTKQIDVEAVHAAILAIDEAGVPVLCRDRSHPRKEVAKMIRRMFAVYGVKGVSVKTPTYSMASTVDVVIPGLPRVVDADGFIDVTSPNAVADRRVEAKVAEVLARAFPQHDDRSDTMTDYFDQKFSIDTRR